jgi:hypothetical protein
LAMPFLINLSTQNQNISQNNNPIIKK